MVFFIRFSLIFHWFSLVFLGFIGVSHVFSIVVLPQALQQGVQQLPPEAHRGSSADHNETGSAEAGEERACCILVAWMSQNPLKSIESFQKSH